MKESVLIRAPAKIILSGEYSVLYGAPALAMAVDRYAEINMSTHAKQDHIAFDLLNLYYNKEILLEKLKLLKRKLQKNYSGFLVNKKAIKKVVKNGFELLQLAFIYLIDKFNVSLTHGVRVKINSTIPIGCGMGSSAATIVGVLRAVIAMLDLEVTDNEFLEFSRDIENFQHGYSSGLDVKLSTMGGCIKLEEGKMLARDIPDLSFMIVNTGRPEVSTGECVNQVTDFLNKNRWLVKELSAVTTNFDMAWQQNDVAGIMEAIRSNHDLLDKVGVVPAKVHNFIGEIEKLGGAAKVCGAGAISGQKAGVVLMMVKDHDRNHAISTLTNNYGYEMFQVSGSLTGAQVI